MNRSALRMLLAGVLLLPGMHATEGGEATTGELRPPEVTVSGLGWWKNRKMRETLALLESDDEPLRRIDVPFVEDAVVILQSALEREGFLQPSGEVIVRSNGTEAGVYPWKWGDVPALPRELAGDAVEFRLEPGVRFRFDRLQFEGLRALRESDARRFFIEEGFLIAGAGTRRFTPAVLKRGVGSLREQLMRMGYADAEVAVAAEERDEARGRVRVSIRVNEGPVHRVGRIQPPANAPAPLADKLAQLCGASTGASWSRIWQQDFLQAVRAVGYAEGFARAEATLEAAGETRHDGQVVRAFRLVFDPGRQVRVGTIKFEGAGRTKLSVLERAVDVRPGDLFLRSEVENDRLKLGSLGVSSSVRVEVDEVSPGLWDLTYRTTPGKQLETSLLAGYGSYEQFRAGVEVYHANLFGRAHRGRLQLVQSLKSTSGDYLYSMPQIFGTVTDASIRVFGLSREEVSFDREELGSSIGLRRHLERFGADAALRYQFESVAADVTDPTLVEDLPTDSRVASLTLDLTRDRRDNPLAPHRGQFLALTVEAAARAIGGEVDYQRVELRGAWHRTIDDGRWLHLGLRHSVLLSSGASTDDIPLAKRFFPGGESTLRGYREGRAAPRNADGVIIGAEVSTVANIEFEQALARNLSAVLFVDAGLTSASIDDWPGEQWRVSTGLGLRYNTIIGPARLEYGHNLVKEPRDQVGELHFALGFPF